MAEGFGASTPGGAGGATIHVTNLNNSGAGSLRAAIQTSGARTVVFNVSGTITLSSALFIDNPNITIDGSTAPAGGITIQNPQTSATGGQIDAFQSIDIRTNDVILRHLAIRPGMWPPVVGEDFPLHTYGVMTHNASNVLIEYCSISHALSRMVSIHDSQDVTLAYCIISHGLPPAPERTNDTFGGKGMSTHGATTTRFSVHHCLFGHAYARCPQLAGDFDMRHCTVYDWTDHGADIINSDGNTRVNWVANTLIPGPDSGNSAGFSAHDWRGYAGFPSAGNLQAYIDQPSQLYLSAIFQVHSSGIGWVIVPFVGSQYQLLSPFSAPSVTPGGSIYPTVGRQPRDAIDTALLLELGYSPPTEDTSVRRAKRSAAFGRGGGRRR